MADKKKDRDRRTVEEPISEPLAVVPTQPLHVPLAAPTDHQHQPQVYLPATWNPEQGIAASKVRCLSCDTDLTGDYPEAKRQEMLCQRQMKRLAHGSW